MINYIDERLKSWARQVASYGSGQQSILARMMSGEVSGSARGRIAIDPDAMEIEEAIVSMASDDECRVAVVIHYLFPGNSTEKAKGMHVSKKKYYELIDISHIKIDRFISGIKN